MTPFAQLQDAEELVKSSSSLLLRGARGAHNLVRNGFWKTVADSKKFAPDAAGLRGRLGRASRLFHNPAAGKMVDGKMTGDSTLLSKGLTGFGFGGVGAEMLGYDVPGSQLAMNLTMPGVGALFTAAPAITSARLMRKGNQDKIVEDAKTGAREAIGDMMSLAQQDSRYASHGDLYRQFMSQYSPDSAAMANRYATGDVKPMSAWQNFSSAFYDPQKIVNNQIDLRVPGLLSKAAMLGKIGRGAGHVLPWLFAAGGVGAVGHAALSDKPYDATQVQQRGYAATQAAMQKKLQNLSGMERMALRFDPTLIGQQAEKLLPGTIAQWERRSGQKYQPGFISGIVDKWNKGGDNSYYEYDAAGTRHYL
jgi:hypothetical protein